MVVIYMDNRAYAAVMEGTWERALTINYLS